MEPFEIEVNIADKAITLTVFPDMENLIFELYEAKNRLGVIYKDLEKGEIWCTDEPIPMELVKLIGKKIDDYQV